MSQQVHNFTFGDTHLRSLVHLPPGYGREKGKRWPLILFLHDALERGSDLDLIKQYGMPKVTEEQADFPFITLSPQCPAGTMWIFQIAALDGLLNEFCATHQVDTKRIYVTGTGMGGYGTWHLAVSYPDRFAAIVPVAGGGDSEAVCAITHLPVWAFHGGLDNEVLVREGRRMYEALTECGGHAKFSVYKNSGHDIWAKVYNDPRLYEWLMSHSK